MQTYLADVARTFRNYKALAEAALAQTGDAHLFEAIDPEANSIAVIMQHVAGNLRSRFQDFLTADGEKPDRDRDAEFEPPHTSRHALVAQWEAGWKVALDTLDALTQDDLARAVRIRGEAFAVPEALNRSVTHTAYHVGQIVFLAKHFAGATWKSLSIPKGQSSAHMHGTFKQGFVSQPR